jgi:hypothetical protein
MTSSTSHLLLAPGRTLSQVRAGHAHPCWCAEEGRGGKKRCLLLSRPERATLDRCTEHTAQALCPDSQGSPLIWPSPVCVVCAVGVSAAGKVKPEAFMAYRMNGQYILEGISGAMMYTLGGEWGRSTAGHWGPVWGGGELYSRALGWLQQGTGGQLRL